MTQSMPQAVSFPSAPFKSQWDARSQFHAEVPIAGMPTADMPAEPRALQLPLSSIMERRTIALTECDRLIQHYRDEATQNKRIFDQLKYACIVLGMLTTLSSGLSVAGKMGEWEWGLPIVSALTTVTTALLTQTNAQKNWVQSQAVQQRLAAEKFLYLQEAGDYGSVEMGDRTRLFSTKIVEIWTESHDTLLEVAETNG
ncbi:MAG: DUF4231 domain-containing protein [Kaiparowitsia implicata GSE-PSE-MK54-09C]|jgi:hypothetical protein|nr:DUF4231 domain-containing protein [Kaiparowitsia implicata GSE-PSE-MK54-09C]